MKYLKKRVEVEAVQFLQTEDSILSLDEFLYCGVTAVIEDDGETREIAFATDYDNVMYPPSSLVGLIIPTNQGNADAIPGDWIIRGINGEYYPCKPDIFAELYDEVGVKDERLKIKDERCEEEKGVIEDAKEEKNFATDRTDEHGSGNGVKGWDHGKARAYKEFYPDKNVKNLAYLEEEIDNMFTYHKPDQYQIGSMAKISSILRTAAKLINNECPASEETRQAIQGIAKVRMHANAAIALHKEMYAQLHFGRLQSGGEKHLMKRIGQIHKLGDFYVTHHRYYGMTAGEDEFVIVDHNAGTVTFKMQYDTIGNVGVVGVQVSDIVEFCAQLFSILNAEFPCEEEKNLATDVTDLHGSGEERESDIANAGEPEPEDEGNVDES